MARSGTKRGFPKSTKMDLIQIFRRVTRALKGLSVLNSKTFSVYFTHRNLFHFSIFSLCKLFRHDGQLMTSKQ